jgi:hypothetical protein
VHNVFYVIAVPLAIIGLIEALPGVFQWLGFIGVRVITLGMASDSMAKIASGFPGGPSIFAFHGMPSAYAFPLFLAGAGASAGFGIFVQGAQEKAEKDAKFQESIAAAKESQQRAEAERIQAEARRESERIRSMIEDAAELAHSIPAHMTRAAAAVALAEREYRDGVLDPFWDAVEVAVTELASVDSATRAIASHLAEYRRAGAPDPATRTSAEVIARGIERLPTTAVTYAKLQAIVRQSQRSPDFTMVYHMRKTNKILVSGFSTLERALGDMANRLEAAVDQVGEAVIDLQSSQALLGTAIAEELALVRQDANEQSRVIREGQEIQASEAARSSASRSAAEAKIIDTLDNIQRGRMPVAIPYKPGTTPRH